jgi:hypothetical protein
MRKALLIQAMAALFLVGLVAFGVTLAESKPAATESATVMATFHVVAGKELDFEQILLREWETYMKGKLVLDQPNVIARGKEADGKTYFVHIFTWADHATPDRPPPSVIAVWQSMGPLIEARNGHPSMEIAQVQLVAPKK